MGRKTSLMSALCHHITHRPFDLRDIQDLIRSMEIGNGYESIYGAPSDPTKIRTGGDMIERRVPAFDEIKVILCSYLRYR